MSRFAPTFRIIGYAIIFAFTLLATISIVKLVTIEEGKDDCIRVYVQSEAEKGYVYYLDERTHLDKEVLQLPVIGTAKGCIVIVSDKIYSSIVNSSYCGVEKVRKSILN